MCAPPSTHPQGERALVQPGWTEKGWFCSSDFGDSVKAGTSPVLRREADEQCGQDPEREE